MKGTRDPNHYHRTKEEATADLNFGRKGGHKKSKTPLLTRIPLRRRLYSNEIQVQREAEPFT